MCSVFKYWTYLDKEWDIAERLMVSLSLLVNLAVFLLIFHLNEKFRRAHISMRTFIVILSKLTES